MSARELHPEDLIDRARRGAATGADLANLAQHLAGCAACRFESALATDTADAALTRSSDELVIARLRRGTIRALLARGVRPRRARFTRGLVLVAAALLVGSASLAGVLGYRALSRPTLATSAPVRPRIAEKAALQRAKGAAYSAPLPAAPSASASVLAPELVRSAPLRNMHSAAELFADANRARRTGDAAQAANGYRELSQRFPGSAEALVARVTFGRLLLDRLGDARGALLEFDSYLGNSSHRALREEALIGRAVALGRLGRPAEERAAWRTLLRAFPSSTYATRARTRLEELGAPAPVP